MFTFFLKLTASCIHRKKDIYFKHFLGVNRHMGTEVLRKRLSGVTDTPVNYKSLP